MKKLSSILLIASLILTFSACGGGTPADTDSGKETDVPAAPVKDLDIFVSPEGDDSGNGTAEHPLASIAAAKELAKTRPGDESLTVWLRDGVYYLSEALSFDETDRTNVAYKAYGDEKPVISGGQIISGWSETEVNGITAFETELPGGVAFQTLSDGKELLPLARYPEEGYFAVKWYAMDDMRDPESGYGQYSLAFAVKSEELKDFKNVSSVRVRLLHTWIDEYIPVDHVDMENSEVWLQWRTGLSAALGDRFFYENVYEALDKPGEWCFDEKEGKVYYIPRNNEVPDGFRLYAGKLNQLIGFNGAKDLTFEGITFTGTDYELSHTSYGFGGWSPAAISGDNSENLIFDNCVFRDLGSGGISLCSRTVGCKITDCVFTDIGMVPIQQHGTYYVSEYDNTPLNAVISNNLIDGYGITYQSCCGILSYNANGVEISHNEICNGYDSAIHISATGCDLANDTRVGAILIRSNYVHDIGFGALNDFGGIYTCGRQPGTEISGNIVRDVHGAGASGGHDYDEFDSHGIYLDMFSAEMEVCNNLVYDCNGWGITYDGADLGINTHNNIFAFCGGGIGIAFFVNAARGVTSTVVNNIFLLESGPMISEYAIGHEDNLVEHNNLYYYLESEEPFITDDLPITDPIIADPLFTDPANGDFTLAEDSPALAAGFTPWDYSSAGRK